MDTRWNRRDFIREPVRAHWGSAWSRAWRFGSGEPKAAIPLAKAKSVIGVYLEGGMTHIDTFDPKPNAPPSVRSFFKPIPTNVPGTEITETFSADGQGGGQVLDYPLTTAPGGGHGGYVMLCNAMNPKESASLHPRPSWSIRGWPWRA